MSHQLILFLSAALLAVSASADPIEDFLSQRGPLATVSDSSTGPNNDFTLYAPVNAGANGVKHAVITWGNGTFANPSLYDGFLDHLASYGFVVIASNSGFTGSGDEMIEGVDWVLAENANPASTLFNAINTTAIGATGHSQGGGGSINAGNDPRVRCSAPIQPVPGDVEGLQGPMFLIAGGTDFIVPASGIETNTYNPSLVPTVYGVLDDASHFAPLGDADGIRGYVTAWFAACLQRNPIAALAFTGACTLCNNPAWTVQRKSGN